MTNSSIAAFQNFQKSPYFRGTIKVADIGSSNGKGNTGIINNLYIKYDKSQKLMTKTSFGSNKQKPASKLHMPDQYLLTAAALLVGGTITAIEAVKGKKMGSILKKAGKATMVAGVLLNGAAFIQSGMRKNQPSEFTAGSLMLATVPLYFINPALWLGAFTTSVGLFFSGLANRIEPGKTSEYNKFKDSFSKETLSGSIKFIKKDQINALKATTKSVKQLWKYVTGKRKELPDIFTIKPNADQRRVSGALMITGGLMMSTAALGIFKPAKTIIGSIGAGLAALGCLGDNVNTIALVNDRTNGFTKNILITGIVLKQLAETMLMLPYKSILGLLTSVKMLTSSAPNVMQSILLNNNDGSSQTQNCGASQKSKNSDELEKQDFRNISWLNETKVGQLYNERFKNLLSIKDF